MREVRQIMAVRTAVWGDAEELRDHIDRLRAGPAPRDDLSVAMAAFGMPEDRG